MPYVDGFVMVVPTEKLAEYRRMARTASRVWMEAGALQYIEAVGDELDTEFGVSFTKMTRAKPNETVVFAWILFKSKAHRNKVNKIAMADPRLDQYDANAMPFDSKRMAYGGFKGIVEATAEE